MVEAVVMNATVSGYKVLKERSCTAMKCWVVLWGVEGIGIVVVLTSVC